MVLMAEVTMQNVASFPSPLWSLFGYAQELIAMLSFPTLATLPNTQKRIGLVEPSQWSRNVMATRWPGLGSFMD